MPHTKHPHKGEMSEREVTMVSSYISSFQASAGLLKNMSSPTCCSKSSAGSVALYLGPTKRHRSNPCSSSAPQCCEVPATSPANWRKPTPTRKPSAARRRGEVGTVPRERSVHPRSLRISGLVVNKEMLWACMGRHVGPHRLCRGIEGYRGY